MAACTFLTLQLQDLAQAEPLSVFSARNVGQIWKLIQIASLHVHGQTTQVCQVSLGEIPRYDNVRCGFCIVFRHVTNVNPEHQHPYSVSTLCCQTLIHSIDSILLNKHSTNLSGSLHATGIMFHVQKGCLSSLATWWIF